MYGKKWTASRTAKREFARQMAEIDEFCVKNGIEQSKSSDSYYFWLNGKAYRVSNHTVEASNRAAFDFTGAKVRDLYHEGGREDKTVYIHAGKTRIIEIYENLKAGKTLDGRGNVKND